MTLSTSIRCGESRNTSYLVITKLDEDKDVADGDILEDEITQYHFDVPNLDHRRQNESSEKATTPTCTVMFPTPTPMGPTLAPTGPVLTVGSGRRPVLVPDGVEVGVGVELDSDELLEDDEWEDAVEVDCETETVVRDEDVVLTGQKSISTLR